jgi:phytoene dehydrogenase-like protein
LAAAITVARAGRSVLVVEANSVAGGGVASEELTLPGYIHDTCSSVYPLGIGSPVFRDLPLEQHGLTWVHPEVPLAHPLDGGQAAVLERSVDATAMRLGADGNAYRDLISPFVENWDDFIDGTLRGIHVPKNPFLLARFGMQGLRSADAIARTHFRSEFARALVAGNGAHSIARLSQNGTAAIALVLMVAGHAVGWPFARGGSRALAQALVSYLKSIGGAVRLDTRVRSLDELPPSRMTFLDLTPRQIIAVGERQLPQSYLDILRKYKYGSGVFKVDWALDGPVPWTSPDCARAGTVHVGGTLDQIGRHEADVGGDADPFVLLAQPSLFDTTRAPSGKHTVWAYCHVPNGSTVDMTARIESQIERFAPGFRDRILARHVLSPADFERKNANLVGGDIGAGAMTLRQLFLRPSLQIDPHRTPVRGLYLCSASTPPGAGVHGMCGYLAATAALREVR